MFSENQKDLKIIKIYIPLLSTNFLNLKKAELMSQKRFLNFKNHPILQ